MNFGINLFVVVCFISGLNAVEMELKAPSNAPGKIIKVDISFPESDKAQCPVELIEITDEAKKYYWVIGEITLKSATNHQTSFMIVNCSQTSTQNATQFITDVCKALIEINKVSVGQKLFEDICSDNNKVSNLVVFNTESVSKIIEISNTQYEDKKNKNTEENGNKEKNEKMTLILNKMPEYLRSLLGWEAPSMQTSSQTQQPQQKQNITTLYEHLSQSIQLESAFANCQLTRFLKNIVYVKKANFKTVLWDANKCEVYRTDEDIPLHLHLFRELNHYRHYTCKNQNKRIYNNEGKPFEIHNNMSTLNISIEGKMCNMQDAEEELQQTGYTVADINEDSAEFFDPVNEISYRIQKNKQQVIFRYPYIDNFSFPLDKHYKVNNADVLKILLHSVYEPGYTREYNRRELRKIIRNLRERQ